MPSRAREAEYINGKKHYPCSKCKVPKRPEEYSKQRARPLGFRSACKVCEKLAYMMRTGGSPRKPKVEKPVIRKVFSKISAKEPAPRPQIYRDFLIMDNLHPFVRILRLAQAYEAPIQAIANRIRYYTQNQVGKDPISLEIEQAVNHFKAQYLTKKAA